MACITVQRGEHCTKNNSFSQQAISTEMVKADSENIRMSICSCRLQKKDYTEYSG